MGVQEVLAVYLQQFPDSAIAINLKACNHFRLYNGKAAEVCTLSQHHVTAESRVRTSNARLTQTVNININTNQVAVKYLKVIRSNELTSYVHYSCFETTLCKCRHIHHTVF